MNQNLKATSYNAIYNDIKEKIDAGILMPGTRIESLRKLSEHYNASDSTIRKSISLLKENNYVYAKERSGIFVREAENNAFTLKFGDTDNFLEQVDAVDILDFCNIPAKDHKSASTKITMVGYTEALPLCYSEKYIINKAHIDVKKENQPIFLKKLDGVLNDHNVRKVLSIEIETEREDIRARLLLSPKEGLFCLVKKYYSQSDKYIGCTKLFVGSDDIALKCCE